MEGTMEVIYPRCAGLDVHKDTVVAAVRLAADGAVRTEVCTFDTTTPGLRALSAWLAEAGCTHVAMEATGVYWKPVWHVLSDGDFTLILANAAHVRAGSRRRAELIEAEGRPRRGRAVAGAVRSVRHVRGERPAK
jgi:transposase